MEHYLAGGLGLAIVAGVYWLCARVKWRRYTAGLAHLPVYVSGTAVYSMRGLHAEVQRQFLANGTRSFWVYRRRRGVLVIRTKRFDHLRGEQWCTDGCRTWCCH